MGKLMALMTAYMIPSAANVIQHCLCDVQRAKAPFDT